MDLSFWSKKDIGLSSFQDELNLLVDNDTEQETMVQVARKLLSEGGSMEFGWAADVFINLNLQHRWGGENSLAPVVKELKDATLKELSKELYFTPNSDPDGANYLSALEMILHHGNSVEELQSVLRLVNNPPNEIVFQHAMDALPKVAKLVILSPKLEKQILSLYREQLHEYDYNLIVDN
ncbi:hypothetical protein BKI52_10080 [marine bacterium AO1-C]|nr:hypothetical protein BKI52_10080 [marine bacterium AO1-C]